MTGPWSTSLARWHAYESAAGRSAATLKLRRSYLERFAVEHPAGPAAVTFDDLLAFVGRPGWSPETRKAARATLRGFYRWAHEVAGMVEANPATGLPVVSVPPTTPRPAPDDVLAAALGRADDRQRVMLLLAAGAGLRRAEIARCHTSWRAGDTLRVDGKGGRVRTVPLTPVLAAELDHLEGEQGEGFYFPGYDDGHLSAGHVGKLLARLLGSKPGQAWRGWSAHTLRHRFATRAYATDRDLLAVQQLLGHSKPETTARYTAIPDDSLRRAVGGAM